VSKQWIQTLKKRLKETGSYEAKPLQGVAGRKRILKEIVTKTPDATREELAEQLLVKVSTSMAYRELQHLKLTYKKNCVRRRTRPTGRCAKTCRVESKATRFSP
jgi:transposase